MCSERPEQAFCVPAEPNRNRLKTEPNRTVGSAGTFRIFLYEFSRSFVSSTMIHGAQTLLCLDVT